MLIIYIYIIYIYYSIYTHSISIVSYRLLIAGLQPVPRPWQILTESLKFDVLQWQASAPQPVDPLQRGLKLVLALAQGAIALPPWGSHLWILCLASASAKIRKRVKCRGEYQKNGKQRAKPGGSVINPCTPMPGKQFAWHCMTSASRSCSRPPYFSLCSRATHPLKPLAMREKGKWASAALLSSLKVLRLGDHFLGCWMNMEWCDAFHMINLTLQQNRLQLKDLSRVTLCTDSTVPHCKLTTHEWISAPRPLMVEGHVKESTSTACASPFMRSIIRRYK